MIEVVMGIPGAGKSLYMAKKTMWLLERNLKWYQSQYIAWQKKKFLTPEDRAEAEPKPRYIYSNVAFSESLHKQYPNLLQYWSDPQEIVKLRDVDIIWDEIATHLDSTQWANVPLELKRWLQQHRKLGLEIYGNTQEFLMIDISMRRLVARVYHLVKLFGSRDPSPTRPPVKKIWGLIWLRRVDPLTFDDEKKRKYLGSSFFWIKRKYVEVYDTRQQIQQGEYPPLKHIRRYCMDPSCELHHSPKITHA